MPTVSDTRLQLLTDNGNPVKGAFAERRPDGAWNVRFQLPWEQTGRQFIRATKDGASQLLIAAAGQVEDELDRRRAEEQRISALADAQPADDRP